MSGRFFQIGAAVSYVLAGVLGGTGALLLYATKNKETDDDVQLSVLPEPGGLSIQGTF